MGICFWAHKTKTDIATLRSLCCIKIFGRGQWKSLGNPLFLTFFAEAARWGGKVYLPFHSRNTDATLHSVFWPVAVCEKA